ncbi:Gx transporter family protein [Erysipelotrichaceae bacterium 66-17]|nr:heptaprenyl diphosphate synthase [Erysipelotrichaceae bacterium]
MSAKKSVILAFLIALGIIFQLIESFFPVVMIVPGYKIGIANIVGLFALYAYGPKDLAVVCLGRIFLASLMQGTLFSVPFILSVTGGIFSMAAMILAYRSKVFSIYGVSILGACFHNIGQVLAITILYDQFFMQLFLPVLLALSIAAGLCIALLSANILKRMKGRLV